MERQALATPIPLDLFETRTVSADPNTSEPTPTPESIAELRQSFFYGTRSNLDFKFVLNLSDAEFGDFLQDLFASLSETMNSGDPTPAIEAAHEWQVRAHAGQNQTPEKFAHVYDDSPIAKLGKPLSECRVALLTSSGHYVVGDDPKPLGVANMSNEEARTRVLDFLKEAPTLSTIPMDTATEDLRLLHPGYPVEAALQDSGVNLPLQHLRQLADAGEIKSTTANAHSFVGAASQLKLKKHQAPLWADQLRDEGADVVLLVPV